MKLGKLIPALCMLLGFTKPGNAIDEGCNYQEYLQPGRTYYVYSPGYPNYYQGQHSCQWRAQSNNRIRLTCQNFNVPGSPNCSREAMIVQVSNDIEYTFCGLKSFTLESQTAEMIIKFRSKFYSLGGQFQCELTVIQQQCNCGWKNPNRIVGGVETGVNEYPMMAGLVDFEDLLIFCGATIITNRHVITAAHCVVKYRNDYSNVGVVVGEHNTEIGNETNATRIYIVERIVIHPNYVGPTTYNDVAIVQVSPDITFSMKVGPVCLPFAYTNKNFTGKTVTALGWGTLDYGGRRSSSLMKVNLGVISQETCAQDYNNITSAKICTYGENRDACQFDSGGPVLYEIPQSGRVLLVGIISYGKTCADQYPGVNTRVTSYLGFIQEVTGSTFCTVY